jgi:hypothetical protein
MKKEKKQTWTVSVLTKNLSPASFSLNSMRLTSMHAQLKRQVIFTWKITKLVLCPNVNPKYKRGLISRYIPPFLLSVFAGIRTTFEFLSKEQ